MWFAFKLCSLYIWLQLVIGGVLYAKGCDLLSNFALCTFDYNADVQIMIAGSVVICFQTLLFVHLITTWCFGYAWYALLWFAFKLCSLYIWLQLRVFIPVADEGCDLLSNFALCTFDYNSHTKLASSAHVVICFQTLLFVHLITTKTT